MYCLITLIMLLLRNRSSYLVPNVSQEIVICDLYGTKMLRAFIVKECWIFKGFHFGCLFGIRLDGYKIVSAILQNVYSLLICQ